MQRSWFVGVPFVLAVAIAASIPYVTRAQQAKVDICHVDGTGRYSVITIADPAYSTHIAHGDTDLRPFYQDADGDGFGSAAVQTLGCATTPPGYVNNALDCDDTDPQLTENCGANNCVEILAHCDPGSEVIQTMCGDGLHVVESTGTPNSISYVRFVGGTTSVVLHNCEGDRTLELFSDTNLCSLEGGCCEAGRWNDSVCAIEIKGGNRP